jgi:hypothetical protein
MELYNFTQKTIVITPSCKGYYFTAPNGDRQEPIPRHNEINEKLARSILRKAKKGGKL